MAKYSIKILTVLMLFLGLAGSAYAQNMDSVRYIVSPEVPGPNQQTIIEIQGIGTFLGESTITWTLNGKVALTGPGETRFSFTTGSVGVTSRVRVTINSEFYGTISRDFAFTPTLITLLWESDTSTPPLYPGKALYSPGSRIKVVAFPQVVARGTTVTANNLSFRWSVNGEPVTAQSGKGRSSITFSGDQLRNSEVVSVDVFFDEVQVGRSTITIPGTAPSLIMYNRDPLRGTLYDQAFPPTVTLTANEMVLKAEPYYFSNESMRSGSLSYTWLLNGNPTVGPDSQRGILTLRKTGSGAGEAQISVSLQNIDTSKFVQSARAVLRILFGGGAPDGSSSFGL